MRAERDLGCSEGQPDRVFAEGLEAGDGCRRPERWPLSPETGPGARSLRSGRGSPGLRLPCNEEREQRGLGK